jgi:3-oxoacyl-[acyl-carrier protein] reductase
LPQDERAPTSAGNTAHVQLRRATAIEDFTVEDFDNLFAVNVRAPFFLVQQLLPIFERCFEGNDFLAVSDEAEVSAAAIDPGRSRASEGIGFLTHSHRHKGASSTSNHCCA